MCFKRLPLACALLAVAVTSPAFAQTPADYPCKVVKFIVPYPPGGASDLLARLLGHGLAQFVDQLKVGPGEYSFASPGSGTPHHMLGELLKLDAGVSATHVSYRGSGPAIQDVLAGHVSFAFEGTSAIIPHLDGGKIRPLATTGERRSPGLPDVPTMSESGYPNFVVTNWYGVFVPKGTPRELVEQINGSVRETMKTPEVAEALAKMDSLNSDYSVQQYQEFVKKEAPYWESLVEQTGAKVD